LRSARCFGGVKAVQNLKFMDSGKNHAEAKQADPGE